MTSPIEFALVTVLIIGTPLAIGFLIGIDRKLTARMQGRVGPPILQPFYDLIKLFGKDRKVMNSSQASFAFAALFLQATAFVLLAIGGDMLMAFFISSAGSFSIVLGAFSARSPFSQIGAQRELLQMLAYEPVLFMAIFAIGYHEGTFMVGHIGNDLVFLLPLALIAILPVVLIKMEKSPYDIATAHSEIVSGPYVEYSGTYLAITKLAHWFDLAVVFGIITLFFQDPNIWVSISGKLLIVAAFFMIALIVDNTAARLTRWRMVAFTLAIGLALTTANIAILFLNDQGVFPWP